MLFSLSKVEIEMKDLEKVRDYFKELLNKENNTPLFPGEEKFSWGRELYDLFKKIKKKSPLET